jgi:hypothetical protein
MNSKWNDRSRATCTGCVMMLMMLHHFDDAAALPLAIA